MADESPSVSALSTDRGLPVGNSPGTGGRRRLHVFIDQNGDPIPVFFDAPAGSFHTRDQATSTPGTPVTVLTFAAVPASTVRRILSIRVSCRFEATWQALAGAVVLADGRTGPGQPTDEYHPLPGITLASGAVITVSVTQTAGPASSVQAMVGGYDEPI